MALCREPVRGGIGLCGVGRTLLSAAFDLDFAECPRCVVVNQDLQNRNPSPQGLKVKIKINVKGGGQECPPHTYRLAGGRRYLKAAFSVVSPLVKRLSTLALHILDIRPEVVSLTGMAPAVGEAEQEL